MCGCDPLLRAEVLEDASSVYSVAAWDGSGMYGMADNFIRSNKEPGNDEGNTFLLALTVVEPYKGESQLLLSSCFEVTGVEA